MKRVILLAIVAISVVSCTQKGENSTASADPHQFGFNYDSTANMDQVKGSFKDLESYDTATYVTRYADTAKFHDNGKITNLEDNVEIQRQFIAAGIKVKVKEDYAMWSSHFNFKDGNQGDYVYTYVTVAFSKGDKTVDVVMFQADMFNKDGKIVEEWMVYDSKQIVDLMNQK
jgi:hypothetical protein